MMSEATINVIDGLGASASGRSLPVIQLEREVYARALDCVHCGLCLPACPTYTSNGLEADSPRGRIMLMKGLTDGTTAATAAVVGHLDLCLGCRACETACPSGVVYHELLEAARPQLEPHRTRSLRDRLVMALVRHVFAYPWRLRLAMLPARVLQRLGLWRFVRHLPLAELLPAGKQTHPPLSPGVHRATGSRKATVGFFTGCVGSVLFNDVNREAVELLQHAGCDVVVPASQGCCGAIHHHSGDVKQARAMARANLAAFAEVDVVVTAVAGCGAMLREYPHLAGGGAAMQVRDISQMLDELGMAPPEHALQLTAAYHDACHLAHVQLVVDPPRRLLSRIPGLTLVPLAESDMCCGAAGTYNLTQPVMARSLGERKIRHIQRTGASACVTGNAGCALQIDATARRLGVKLDVFHPVTLLHRAVFGRERL
jgi:glycolate oxidase iron-sulfur subunit